MTNNKETWIVKAWNNISQYISGAVARIFSPNDDKYPDVGIQPFEGDPYQQSQTEW
jgi:hypothetical protein